MKRPQLSQSVIRGFQRERIERAVVAEVAERGYASTTVAHVVSTAGIARNTFYENFSSKDAAFGTAFTNGVEAVAAAVEEAVAEAGPSIEDRAAGALESLTGFVDANPQLVRVILVDGPAAAPMGLEVAMQRFARLTALPSPFDELVVGGVAAILYRRAVERDERPAAELLPELRAFVLAPHEGQLAAA